MVTTCIPPVAEKKPVMLEHHGVQRCDNYYWLRDDKRADAKVLAYLNQENDYCQQQLMPYQSLQTKLFNELIGRLEQTPASVPYYWQQHWYQRVYEAGQEYPLFTRFSDLDADKQLLLDVPARAQAHEFYSLGGISVSPDEQYLAFAEDTLSRRIYTVYFKNLVTDELLDYSLNGVDGGVVWANDNQHLFYIAKDPQTLLGYQVFRHKLGSSQVDDVLVYEEQDDSYYLSLSKSLDRSTISLYLQSTTTTEVLLLDADKPLSEFRCFYPREEGHEYSIAKLDNSYLVLTNWQATNFRLMKVDAANTTNKQAWQALLPYQDEVRIEDFIWLRDYLVIQSREQGQTQIDVYSQDLSTHYRLLFDDVLFVAGFDVNVDQNSHKLRVYYSSLTTPESIYEYDLSVPNQRQLLKQEQVIGEFDSQNYQAERLMVPARDGALVPVSLVYRKDQFNQDGTNPLYQYGYGAYGYTVEPEFDSAILSLLDRGVVYAIAHVRGSEMLGRPWYDAGKLQHKQNSFTDFIDVTRYLVANQYAAQDKVVASGGSAGGLLMGAVANMAAADYFAIAAHVPFVDVVTTMLDETIPLTTNEYDEWGNPNHKADFEYMLSYSPYDQVSKQAYPNLLVTTGLHDSQVQYFEPAKWVAKLRDYKTDDNLLLLHTDMEAGHGGKSGRFQQYQDTALEYSFLLGLLGYKQ